MLSKGTGVKIEIFTSPTCPYCTSAIKIAKQVAKEYNGKVKVIETSTATGKGARRARKFGIMSVPTVFVSGPATMEILAHRGTPSTKRLKQMVNIALGIEDVQKNNGSGLFNRILRLLK